MSIFFISLIKLKRFNNRCWNSFLTESLDQWFSNLVGHVRSFGVPRYFEDLHRLFLYRFQLQNLANRDSKHLGIEIIKN